MFTKTRTFLNQGTPVPEIRPPALSRGLVLLFAALCFACLPGCIKKKAKVDEAASPRIVMTSPSGLMREAMNGKDTKIVSGGWGYIKEQAMILGVPADERGKAMDYAPLITAMIELRNLEEFTRAPELGKRFEVTGFFRRQEGRVVEKGRTYLHITGAVNMVAEKDLSKARQLVNKANGGGHDVHNALEPLTTTVERHYWFDITDPVSHNAKHQAIANKNASAPKRAQQPAPKSAKKPAPATAPKPAPKPASKPSQKPAQRPSGKK